MRLMLMSVALGCVCLFGADDETEYKAYKETQEQMQRDAQSLAVRDTTVTRVESDIISLKERYKGMSADEALTKWAEDIRKNTDPVQRWSQYEWYRRVKATVEGLKVVTKTLTADAAITAEKVSVSALKEK